MSGPVGDLGQTGGMYAKGSAEWDERLDERRAANEAFRAAYYAVHPEWDTNQGEALGLGWTTSTVLAVTALADWAIEHALPLAYGTNRHMLYGSLEDVADRMIRRQGMTVEETLPWLAALVGVPSHDVFDEFRRLVQITPDGYRASEHEPESSIMGGWRRAAADDVAALAWAAGLSSTETADRNTTGTLGIPDLHLLALLRGFRLPPAHLATEL